MRTQSSPASQKDCFVVNSLTDVISLQTRKVVAVALPLQVWASEREAPAVQGDARHAGLVLEDH